MAPSTTGSPGPAASGNGTSSHLGQRRPAVKGPSTNKKPHVVPVLPLPLTKPRHRSAHAAFPSPTAAAKSPTSTAPGRSPTSPLAVEIDLPNIASLAIAPSTNGASSPATKNENDAARNGNGQQQAKQLAADAPARVEPALASSQPQQLEQERSFAGHGQGLLTANTRAPLAAYRSTNAIHPPVVSSPAAPNGYVREYHPPGKENIPPNRNDLLMAQPPPFEPAHQSHLSLSDSSIFAHQDSNNTSPVPPETGSYHQAAHQTMAPWTPVQNLPPPGMGMAMAQGMPYYPQVQGRPPVVAPSTPQSFHGSQTSNAPDGQVGQVAFDDNYYGRPQPLMTANGHADINGGFAPAPNSARQSQFLNSRSIELSRMHQHQMRECVERSFNHRDSADCQLAIYLMGNSDDVPWRQPVLLYGHRFILNFSPTLNHHLQTIPIQGGTLEMNSDDPYMRTDVLWVCLGSLYGLPIPEHPITDPFLAGSYVAAGHFLQLGAVALKGAEDVVRMIQGWDRLEMACAIALNGAMHQFPGSIHPSSTADVLLRYGPASERILDAVASFMIDNFPHNYVVDSKYPLPRYSRIPPYPEPYKSDNEAVEVPSVDENTIQHESLPKYSNPALSQIKFGDVPLPAKKSTGAQKTQPSKPNKPATPEDHLAASDPNPNRIITSILANLPFGVLKDIMESNRLGKGPGQPATGWPTTQNRFKIMKQIITEREHRRADAINAVVTDMAANLSVKNRLCGPHPPIDGPLDGWDVLGWKEEVAGSDEAPHLVRSWVPLTPTA